jgi:hypothetical protein
MVIVIVGGKSQSNFISTFMCRDFLFWEGNNKGGLGLLMLWSLLFEGYIFGMPKQRRYFFFYLTAYMLFPHFLCCVINK